jgi:hypothetical protein
MAFLLYIIKMGGRAENIIPARGIISLFRLVESLTSRSLQLLTKEYQMNNTNQNNNNFDIDKQFQNLLKNSQESLWDYDNLLQRIKALVNTLDQPLQLVFKDIIKIYDKKIKERKENIITIKKEFEKFNKN